MAGIDRSRLPFGDPEFKGKIAPLAEAIPDLPVGVSAPKARRTSP